MTAEDNGIIKAARSMIERYGDNALKEVDLRIKELREHKQTEAHNLWIEIRKAVILLTDSSDSLTKH